jgi:hypothetical protein
MYDIVHSFRKGCLPAVAVAGAEPLPTDKARRDVPPSEVVRRADAWDMVAERLGGRGSVEGYSQVELTKLVYLTAPDCRV